MLPNEHSLLNARNYTVVKPFLIALNIRSSVIEYKYTFLNSGYLVTLNDKIRSSTNFELSSTNEDFFDNDGDVREYEPLDSQSVSGLEHRRYRRSSQHPNCGQWSQWVSRHTPTTADKGDSETYTSAEIENFCPYAMGGNPTNFECADEKGEPFSGTRTSANRHFRLDCNDITIGAKCTVLVSALDKCPDLKMRYKCTCGPPPVNTSTTKSTTVPTTTKTTTVPMTTKTTTVPTTTKTTTIPTSKSTYPTSYSSMPSQNPLAIGGTETKVQTINVCGLSIKWWIFDLAVSLFLFLLNIVISILLYKKAVRLIAQRRNDKIHPAHKNIMF
ncbi:hypothetical protein ACF0H5_002944 [Mactra antiquata]